MKPLRTWVSAILAILLFGCNPKLDVYAPEKELFVVYGVLNPDAPVQFVTVTKVFQYEGDAYLYAAQNDLTARGLHLTLQGDSMTWTAQLVEVPDSTPGLFPLTTGAYRFETSGPMALREGQRYDLSITRPVDPQFLITAHTTIPTRPELLTPGPPIYAAQNQIFTLPELELSEENDILFNRGSGAGFELRIYVEYDDNGQVGNFRWGPTPVFQYAKQCVANEDRGQCCYQIPSGSVPNRMHSAFAAFFPDTVEVWDTMRVAGSVDSLNRKLRMEVTGIDSFLTTYLIANQPFGFGLNLLMDKPEYSNISGENTGIFGAINTHSQYFFLGSCARWMAGLRGERPPTCPQ